MIFLRFSNKSLRSCEEGIRSIRSCGISFRRRSFGAVFGKKFPTTGGLPLRLQLWVQFYGELNPMSWDTTPGEPCGKQTVCELEAIAIEIVDLPSYNMVIFHSYVNVYQRVTILIYQLMTGTALPSRETCAVTLQ